MQEQEAEKPFCALSLTHVGLSQQQAGGDQLNGVGAVDVDGTAQAELGGRESFLVFTLRKVAFSHQPANVNQLCLGDKPKVALLHTT